MRLTMTYDFTTSLLHGFAPLGRIPNKETLRAFKEAAEGRHLKRYKTVEEMFNDLLE